MKTKHKLTKIMDLAKPLFTSKMFMSFGISFLLAIVSLNTDLYRVEAFFYDLRMRWKGSELAHPDIVLMYLREKKAVDSPELEDNLESHLKALENLVKQKPRAIVYLNKFDPVDIETKPEIADRFVEVAQKAEAQGIRISFGTDVDLSGEVLPPYPLSLLPHYPSILHKDDTIFAEDKVMRRALLTILKEPSIHMRVAFPDMTKDELLEKARQVRGSYYFGPARERFLMIRYPQTTAKATNAFPSIEFANVIEGKDTETVAGKILLVHSMRKEAINDYVFTPFSRSVYTNPRVLVHASILDTLLKNKGMIPVRRAVDALDDLLLGVAAAFGRDARLLRDLEDEAVRERVHFAHRLLRYASIVSADHEGRPPTELASAATSRPPRFSHIRNASGLLPKRFASSGAKYVRGAALAAKAALSVSSTIGRSRSTVASASFATIASRSITCRRPCRGAERQARQSLDKPEVRRGIGQVFGD